MASTWLITGCSTGFGRILAEAVLARGDNVVATARNPASLEDLVTRYPATARTAVLDVTRPGDAAAAVALAESTFGRLEFLVNNAGYGLVGAIEEVTSDEYRPMYETNVFGLIETTKVALPALRRAGRGQIINFSSVGGQTSRAGFGHYCSTKFAVEAISEALAQEVAPFGLTVTIVEPGPFRTDFLGRSITTAALRMPEYETTVGGTRTYKEDNDGAQAGDPVKGVAVLLRAIDSAQPPLRLALGTLAFAGIRAKLQRVAVDLDEWEADGSATSFD